MMETVLVIGLGSSGQAATRLLLSKGYRVFGVDKKIESLCFNHPFLFLYHEEDFDSFDGLSFVVVSPGIAPTHPLYQKSSEKNLKIISEAELGLSYLKIPAIGITGSNGKTTMSLFLTHLFLKASIKAVCVGNVGYPICDFVLSCQDEEVCVVELSSYQLEKTFSKSLDMAIILDITPDHMDRYLSFLDYAKAKFRIFSLLKNTDRGFVTFRTYETFKKPLSDLGICLTISPKELDYENKNCYLQLTKNKEYCDFLPVVREKALGLLTLYFGLQCCHLFKISKKILLRALETFEKPKHRLEFVAKIEDKIFINDSKATNVESVIYAVNIVQEPVYLIVGGRDKNLDFSSWNQVFKGKVEKIFAIGETAEKIKESLSESHSVDLCKDLQEAVSKAHLLAKKQATILLSPGCASFDQFKDYKHRGECFKEYVMALKKG